MWCFVENSSCSAPVSETRKEEQAFRTVRDGANEKQHCSRNLSSDSHL